MRGWKSTTTTGLLSGAFRITTRAKIVGDILDLAIRDSSDGHKSLDDVMRAMNEQYAKQGSSTTIRRQ